jgi:hypothetical protein
LESLLSVSLVVLVMSSAYSSALCELGNSVATTSCEMLPPISLSSIAASLLESLLAGTEIDRV